MHRGWVLLVILFAARGAFGCDELPSGQTLWIRLVSPVSSYTAKPGDAVHAVLTQDLVFDNEVILPMGTAMEGIVRSKRKVGFGIRHETAALELQFNRAVPDSGRTLTIATRVDEVMNAREAVRKGVIEGVRSTDTFQGRINSRLIHLPTWNPYSDPVLIAFKAVFPIFPEPEIYYPAGTDIRLQTTAKISLAAMASYAPELSTSTKADSAQFDSLVGQLPLRVVTKKNLDADPLNIVFLGDEEQVRSAFQQAGWHNAVPASKHAALKNLYALLNNSGYAQQPMMTFLLDGKPQDMSLQKSLNSYDRRDHLRIWRWSAHGDQPVWVSSSTHDTRAALNFKSRSFVHHIAADVDEERSSIIRDLNFSGCVRSVSYVSRPEMPTDTHNATGDPIHTDGSVAVVTLQSCQPDSQTNLTGSVPFKAGNHVFRFARRQILTFRSDIVRANILYSAYEGGRMMVKSLRHAPAPGVAVTASPREKTAGDSCAPLRSNRRSGDTPEIVPPLERAANPIGEEFGRFPVPADRPLLQ
ncbi:MAG TPA: LssY C-terminal domain-containing protein [Edaphobacter sp.]|jgi:hypothetical protein